MKLEIKQRVAALRKFMQGNGIQAFICQQVQEVRIV